MFGFRPNIVGEVNYSHGSGYGFLQPSADASGPFNVGSNMTRPLSVSQNSTGAALGFNASLANSLYQGNKLQLNALQVLVCVKF